MENWCEKNMVQKSNFPLILSPFLEAQETPNDTQSSKMTSQKIDREIFWPPREFPHKTSKISETQLTKAGIVESWTTLAAGGAPSEFSIRAPILGGISTVFVKLNDGPKGVFLVVDDNDDEIRIGANGVPSTVNASG